MMLSRSKITLNGWQESVVSLVATSNVVICSAERGMGSTTLGLWLCRREAEQGNTAVYVSPLLGEMEHLNRYGDFHFNLSGIHSEGAKGRIVFSSDDRVARKVIGLKTSLIVVDVANGCDPRQINEVIDRRRPDSKILILGEYRDTNRKSDYGDFWFKALYDAVEAGLIAIGSKPTVDGKGSESI